jgi:hypothetical protein
MTSELHELFYARECNCFPDFPTVYCPFAVKYCYRPSRWTSLTHPGCLTDNEERQDRAFNLVLLLLAWYPLLFACILCTPVGRSSISYMFSCLPGWNRFMASRMLKNDRPRAKRFIRNYLIRNQRMMERRIARENARSEGTATQQVAIIPQGTANDVEQQSEIQPISLALRTRIFKEDGLNKQRSKFEIDDEEDGDTCAICFAPLIDGDRVGALPCDHVFHVECLKPWLQKHNRCPLCQTQNIATPRFDESRSATEDESSISTMADLTLDETPSSTEEESTPLEEEKEGGESLTMPATPAFNAMDSSADIEESPSTLEDPAN